MLSSAVADEPLGLRRRIDARLAELLAVPGDPALRSAMAEAVLAGGRRLRAILALLACRAVGGEDAEALDLACAVEMVHAASLALDDLPAMDDAAERRGLPALHRRHGEAVAILASVALLARAFDIAGECDRRMGIAAVSSLARAVGPAGMCSGQVADLAGRRGGGVRPIAPAMIERLHRRKSGCLIAAACELGAMAGGGGPAARRVLAGYGSRLGIAYQIVDDIADVEGDRSAGQPNMAAALGATAAAARARGLLAGASRAVRRAGADPGALDAFAAGLLAAAAP